MSTGKELRLRRIIRPDTGRCILFALSHGTSTVEIFPELDDTPDLLEASLAGGADCILIIMAAVDDVTAGALCAYAKAWRMDAIAEVHDQAELDRALRLDCRLIGINNRDLRTFHTTLETTEKLAPRVPHDRIVISESGIATHADLDRLARAGVRAFLVGESLMRQPDVTAATRVLLEGAA